MSIWFKGLRPLAFGLCLIVLVPARAEEPVKKDAKKPVASKFLRIQRDDKKQITGLETAVTRYAAGEDGVTVDLIAAVHIGDKEYYEKLNKLMEQYDVLLYELVAEEGKRPPKGGDKKKDNPVAMLQQMAKVMLDLEFQLEQVDYTKKNFVHADMSPKDMAEAMKKRGDDGLTLSLSIVSDMLRQQNLKKMKDAPAGQPAEDIDIASLMLDPERALKLKRVMATQFEALDDADGGGFGKTINTILVEDRNKAALKVLQQQIAKGKKKVGIFYGAAHMPDFEKRLRDDFDLKKQKEEWLQAWDMKVSKKKSGIEDLFKLLLDD